MARHLLKTASAALGLVAMFTAASVSGAYAFTETPVPPPSAKPGQKSESVVPQLQKPEDGGAGLELTTPGSAKSGGTELTIPGVGTIGNLPKLNFGLELLYGGNNGSSPDNPVTQQNDDVLIKGTIKHRF
jgi:hypothetical protein